MRYAMAGGGKMLRPLLLLLSCKAVGGDTAHALPAAIALELVHNFTLVHDDIMDHDDLRRGRETVYKKWDENVAILAGDGLLVQAFSSLRECETALLPGRWPILPTASWRSAKVRPWTKSSNCWTP